MYYHSKKLIGMPVIALSTGQQMGRIKKVIIEPQKLNVAGFILDRKGWFKEQAVIPYSQVKNVGNHAVTLDQGTAVAKLSSLPELENLVKNPLPLLGARVITEEGAALGPVEEFQFDPQNGHIHYLVLRSGLVKGNSLLDTTAILKCGRDAIIARSGAEELLQRPRSLLSQGWRNTSKEIAQTWSNALHYGRQVINSLSHQWQKAIPGNKTKKPPTDNE